MSNGLTTTTQCHDLNPGSQASESARHFVLLILKRRKETVKLLGDSD